MDVTLGPWMAEKSVAEAQRKVLTEAMADEAWKVVKKSPNFNPMKVPANTIADKGYSINGRVIRVTKLSAGTEVVATFNILVDGKFSNVPMMQAKAMASGRATAEDALRASTESKVQMILTALQTGKIVSQG